MVDGRPVLMSVHSRMVLTNINFCVNFCNKWKPWKSVNCPQGRMSELRRSWLLYLRERLNRLRERWRMDETWRGPFEGAVAGYLYSERCFISRELKHRQQLRWPMLSPIARISPCIPVVNESRPRNSQVCAIGRPCLLSSLSHDRFCF